MFQYENWINALEIINIKPISDDTCCKLMAILYVFGGSSEVFTHNIKLVVDIKYAQRRMNLFGGEIANIDLLSNIKSYIKELQPNGLYGEDVKCDWAIELMNKYNINM